MTFTTEELSWVTWMTHKWWQRCKTVRHTSTWDDFYTAALTGLWKAKTNYVDTGESTLMLFARLCMRTSIVDWLRKTNPFPRTSARELGEKHQFVEFHKEDVYETDPRFRLVDVADAVQCALSQLSERERFVLIHSFFYGETLEEISVRMKLSSPTIGRYKLKAQEKCKELLLSL